MEDNGFEGSTSQEQNASANDAADDFSGMRPDLTGGTRPDSRGDDSGPMVYCSRCGAPNAPTARFCDRCGSALVVNVGSNMNDPRVYEAVTRGTAVPPRYQYGQAPVDSESGKPTGALVCGILSIVFGIFFSIVGLILGIVGSVMASNAKKNGARGSMATAATVTSVIGLVFSIIELVGCALIGTAAIQYGLQYGGMNYW